MPRDCEANLFVVVSRGSRLSALFDQKTTSRFWLTSRTRWSLPPRPKARHSLAQGKASRRAPPWVTRPRYPSPERARQFSVLIFVFHVQAWAWFSSNLDRPCLRNQTNPEPITYGPTYTKYFCQFSLARQASSCISICINWTFIIFFALSWNSPVLPKARRLKRFSVRVMRNSSSPCKTPHGGKS